MLEVVGHQYWVCLHSQAFVTFSAYYLEQGKDVEHAAYLHLSIVFQAVMPFFQCILFSLLKCTLWEFMIKMTLIMIFKSFMWVCTSRIIVGCFLIGKEMWKVP